MAEMAPRVEFTRKTHPEGVIRVYSGEAGSRDYDRVTIYPHGVAKCYVAGDADDEDRPDADTEKVIPLHRIRSISADPGAVDYAGVPPA